MSFFTEDFYTEIVVKRFEYLYEALWKTAKEFLRVRGIECYSPRLRDRLLQEDIYRLFMELLLRLKP